MNELIETIELILEKSEKNKDGSYYLPKWLAQKLIRKLHDCRKKEKLINKKESKKSAQEEKVSNNVEAIIDKNEIKVEDEWGRRKVRVNSFRKENYELT